MPLPEKTSIWIFLCAALSPVAIARNLCVAAGQKAALASATPYYLCQTKGCSSYGKSIRRDNVEGDFETLLKQMRPNASLFKLVRAMLYDAWDQRMKQAGDPHDVVR